MSDVTSEIAAWGRRSRAVRIERLSATRDELSALVRGIDAATLTRRPSPDAWSAVEVVCHLRDLKESFHDRMALIVAGLLLFYAARAADITGLLITAVVLILHFVRVAGKHDIHR